MQDLTSGSTGEDARSAGPALPDIPRITRQLPCEHPNAEFLIGGGLAELPVLAIPQHRKSSRRMASSSTSL